MKSSCASPSGDCICCAVARCSAAITSRSGLSPEGPKERAGDFRTPEGRYQLTRRNARSDYFLSIQVSYPNDEDLRRARTARVDPGGAIMLHGLPNSAATPARLLCPRGLDRRLHRHVQFRHGRGVADDPGQHPDRNPALTRASRTDTSVIVPDAVDARVGPARQPREPVPGRDRQAARHQPDGSVPAVPQLRARGAQCRQPQRQREGDLRALPQLRRADRAPRLGHQARDHERARPAPSSTAR